MKSVPAVLAALLISGPALAQANGHAAEHPAAAPDGATAEGSGQVKSLDIKAGTVTIHHGPIAALGWPAMTMAFKATPDVLKTAKPGQTVRFTLKGADNQLVAIQPQ